MPERQLGASIATAHGSPGIAVRTCAFSRRAASLSVFPENRSGAFRRYQKRKQRSCLSNAPAPLGQGSHSTTPMPPSRRSAAVSMASHSPSSSLQLGFEPSRLTMSPRDWKRTCTCSQAERGERSRHISPSSGVMCITANHMGSTTLHFPLIIYRRTVSLWNGEVYEKILVP